MKILFVGSESSPFSKTGGLGDVLGSLPKELVKMEHDVRVVLPKHGITKMNFNTLMEPVTNYKVPVGDKLEYAGIEKIVHEGVCYYFIDNEYYFGYRDTLYGHYDDGERYAFFNNAVLIMLEEIDFYPDVINCNDWQSGLIPYILHKNYKSKKKYKDIKTLMTIHNIAYQGVFSKDLLKYLNVEYGSELEYDNMINFLKCGINTADFVTTVSETYAEEILHDYFGYGMNNILNTRRETLFGIVNGIDYESFSPEFDKKIFFNFKPYNYLKGKALNKKGLRNYFDLEENKKPVVGVVSRLTEAKGFDLIQSVIEDLLIDNKIQLVILGSGDSNIEGYFEELRKRHPNNVGVYIGYSDSMARKIYAGSDFFLMPSRFEPCGLAQLISLKYGTIPIVRRTGGLKDTIIPYNKYTLEGNGFGFDDYNDQDMKNTISFATDIFKNKKLWNPLVKKAMLQDFSWRQSALKYVDLYRKLKGE